MGIYKHSEETKKKIIEARKNQIIIHSEETKRKISISCKGRIGMTAWNKGLKGFMSGSNSPSYKGKVSLECNFCNEKYEVYPVHKDRSKFCSKECSNSSKIGVKHSPEWIEKRRLKNSGENHYNFKGWKSKQSYGIGWNKFLKDKIRERDNYKCQSCGVPQIECTSKLSVHHINEIKTDLNINNLISLCRSCHGRIHFNIIKCPTVKIL